MAVQACELTDKALEGHAMKSQRVVQCLAMHPNWGGYKSSYTLDGTSYTNKLVNDGDRLFLNKVRNATIADAVKTSSNSKHQKNAVGAFWWGGNPAAKSQNYRAVIIRAFMQFDTSAISSTADKIVELRLFSEDINVKSANEPHAGKYFKNTYMNVNVPSIQIFKSNELITTNPTDESQASWNNKNVYSGFTSTAYSDPFSALPSKPGFVSIPLNQAAKDDIVANGTINICIREYAHDVSGVSPEVPHNGGDANTGCGDLKSGKLEIQLIYPDSDGDYTSTSHDDITGAWPPSYTGTRWKSYYWSFASWRGGQIETDKQPKVLVYDPGWNHKLDDLAGDVMLNVDGVEVKERTSPSATDQDVKRINGVLGHGF